MRCLTFLVVLGVGALLTTSATYRKKYTVNEFEKLSWEVFPPEAEELQRLSEDTWSIHNTLHEVILLIAPYEEESFMLSVTLKLRGRTPSRAGIFFNLQDGLEKTGRPTLMALEIDGANNYYFSAIRDGSRQQIETKKLSAGSDASEETEISLKKLGDELTISVGDLQMRFSDDVNMPTGSFGFILSPKADVTLTDFRFARFTKEHAPFENVDVQKLWPKEKKS